MSQLNLETISKSTDVKILIQHVLRCTQFFAAVGCSAAVLFPLVKRLVRAIGERFQQQLTDVIAKIRQSSLHHNYPAVVASMDRLMKASKYPAKDFGEALASEFGSMLPPLLAIIGGQCAKALAVEVITFAVCKLLDLVAQPLSGGNGNIDTFFQLLDFVLTLPNYIEVRFPILRVPFLFYSRRPAIWLRCASDRWRSAAEAEVCSIVAPMSARDLTVWQAMTFLPTLVSMGLEIRRSTREEKRTAAVEIYKRSAGLGVTLGVCYLVARSQWNVKVPFVNRGPLFATSCYTFYLGAMR